MHDFKLFAFKEKKNSFSISNERLATIDVHLEAFNLCYTLWWYIRKHQVPFDLSSPYVNNSLNVAVKKSFYCGFLQRWTDFGTQKMI